MSAYRFKQGQRAFFDKLVSSPEYLNMKVPNQFIGDARSFLRLSGSEFILDVGCGDGRYIPLICNGVLSEGLIVGIDLSEAAAKACNRRLNEDHCLTGKTAVVICDAERLPFSNGVFDVLLIIDILHHLPTLRVLREIKRVTRTHAKCIVNEAVLDNPVMFSLRKLFPLIPKTIRRYLRKSYSDLEVPAINIFSSMSLKAHLKSLGFQIARERRYSVFPYYVLEYVPWFGKLFRQRVEIFVRHIDESLSNSPILSKLSEVIVIFGAFE